MNRQEAVQWLKKRYQTICDDDPVFLDLVPEKMFIKANIGHMMASDYWKEAVTHGN